MPPISEIHFLLLRHWPNKSPKKVHNRSPKKPASTWLPRCTDWHWHRSVKIWILESPILWSHHLPSSPIPAPIDPWKITTNNLIINCRTSNHHRLRYIQTKHISNCCHREGAFEMLRNKKAIPRRPYRPYYSIYSKYQPVVLYAFASLSNLLVAYHRPYKRPYFEPSVCVPIRRLRDELSTLDTSGS